LLPNLLIIGAAKCGTTSLHEYLALHPEISMSARKELMLFDRSDWRERIDWYSDQFPEGLPVRGESSPSYSMSPFLPAVAENVHELIPDAKLIYLVGDPVERAIRHYVEYVALFLEDRPIDVALSDFDDPANPYLCTSRYASQLDHFLECFGSEQILVLDQVDLLESRQAVLREVFRFLQVGVDFSSPKFMELHNTESEKVRYGSVGLWLIKRRILMRRRRSFRRGPLIAPLHRLLSRPIDRELSASVRERLVEHLQPDVDRLRELTGREFGRWTSFPPRSAPAARLGHGPLPRAIP
jgi:sulfotransferase family protein